MSEQESYRVPRHKPPEIALHNADGNQVIACVKMRASPDPGRVSDCALGDESGSKHSGFQVRTPRSAFFMRYDLRNFQCEDIAFRCLAGASVDSGYRWCPVKCRIHFDRVEFRGVISQKIVRLRPSRIE
jgi:hypothetical protein